MDEQYPLDPPDPGAPPPSESVFAPEGAVHPMPMPAVPGQLFSVGNAFSLGGQAFTSCYGTLLAVAAISFAIGMARFLIGMVIPVSDIVLAVFVEWPFYPGMAYVGICAAREGRANVEDMFIGFKCYGRSLLLVLMITLIVIACMMPGMLVLLLVTFGGASMSMPAAVMVPIGIVLGFAAFIPMLYVSARLGLAYGMVVDPVMFELPAMQALSRSWAMTREMSWPLTGLLILLMLISGASVLLLCVGYVFLGLPLFMAIGGAAYWLIVGNNQGRSCLACGYDLTGGVGQVCPECGMPVQAI